MKDKRQKIIYDYSKLNGKITEICGTQEVFAKRIGLSDRSVTYKLNNQRDFKQSDIEAAIMVLGISREEISLYFYTPAQNQESVKLISDDEEC